MSKERNVVEIIDEEENDLYSDDSLFNIRPWGADLSFRELIDRYDEGELVKPELQRHYVWDRTEASRFIDSLLLGLPVPSIFLAQTEDERLLIIDGYQRIMTVRDFVRGIFSKDGKTFALAKSEKVNSRWRGKTFGELPEQEQRRVKNTTIHAIIFSEQKSSSDVDTSLFQVFERINTSGRSLTAQEIRNCVAQGSLNELLFELNQNEKWRKLFGTDVPDSRMRDMEYILRFFALSSEQFKNETKDRLSLRQFLDIYMKGNAKAGGPSIASLKDRFERTVGVIWQLFGKSAFHNISPSDESKFVPKFSPTIFDSFMIAADHEICSQRLAVPADPMSAKRELLKDDDYRFVITKETMRRQSIRRRIRMASEHLFGGTYE